MMHQPVMLREVLDNLNPKPGQVFIDGTLGLSGHSHKILEKISPTGRLIGFDRDQQSMVIAKNNLTSFSQQCHFVHDDFRNFDKVLFIAPVLIFIVGILSIYSASFKAHELIYQTLAMKQVLWMGVGILLVFLIIRTDYFRLK